jgi:zinc protease
MAERTYGQVPRGQPLPPRVRPQEPDQKTARTVTLRDARVALPNFQKSWVVPSYRTAEPGQAEALDVLSEILGGGIRSRLYDTLVVKSDMASSVAAYYRGDALDDGSFTITGSPRVPDRLAELEAAVDAELARIADEGVTADELADAKARFVRSTIFARDSQTGMARIYGSTLTTGGTVEEIAEWPDRIKAVTAEQVKQAAKRFLDLSTATTGYLLPAQDGRS